MMKINMAPSFRAQQRLYVGDRHVVSKHDLELVTARGFWSRMWAWFWEPV